MAFSENSRILLSLAAFYLFIFLAIGSFTYFSSFLLAALPLAVLLIGFLSALILSPKASKRFFAIGDILYYLVFGGFIGLIGLAASDAAVFSKQINDQNLLSASSRLVKLEADLIATRRELEQVNRSFAAFEPEQLEYCRGVLRGHDDRRDLLEPKCLELRDLNDRYRYLAGRLETLPESISDARARVEQLTEAPEDVVAGWLESFFGGRSYIILQLVPSLLLSAVAHKVNKSFRALIE